MDGIASITPSSTLQKLQVDEDGEPRTAEKVAKRSQELENEV